MSLCSLKRYSLASCSSDLERTNLLQGEVSGKLLGHNSAAHEVDVVKDVSLDICCVDVEEPLRHSPRQLLSPLESRIVLDWRVVGEHLLASVLGLSDLLPDVCTKWTNPPVRQKGRGLAETSQAEGGACSRLGVGHSILCSGGSPSPPASCSSRSSPPQPSPAQSWRRSWCSPVSCHGHWSVSAPSSFTVYHALRYSYLLMTIKL